MMVTVARITRDTINVFEYDQITSIIDRVTDEQGYPGLKHIPILELITDFHVALAYKGNTVLGWLVLSEGVHPLDRERKLLQQVSMWTEMFGVAPVLFDYMIDYGKKNNCNIITMITDKTRIKPKSLEKKGFKPMETLYILEV